MKTDVYREIKKAVTEHHDKIKWEQIGMTKFRKDARRLFSRVQEYPYRLIFLTSYGKPHGVLVGTGMCSVPTNGTTAARAIEVVFGHSYFRRMTNDREVLSAYVNRKGKPAGVLLNQGAVEKIFGVDFKIPERE